MEPIAQLADEIYRDRVLRARRMSPEEKMLAGPRLFEMACQIARDGIRSQHPEATEEEVHAMLRRRLAIGRRLEECR
jgi:hypothetical protein